MTDTIINTKFTQTFSTTNGVVSEDALKFAKQTLLFNAVRNLTSLVQHRSDYPTKTTTDVDFKFEAVLVDKKRYDTLLKLEQLLSKPEITV
jgi:hypothetical protein